MLRKTVMKVYMYHYKSKIRKTLKIREEGGSLWPFFISIPGRIFPRTATISVETYLALCWMWEAFEPGSLDKRLMTVDGRGGSQVPIGWDNFPAMLAKLTRKVAQKKSIFKNWTQRHEMAAVKIWVIFTYVGGSKKKQKTWKTWCQNYTLNSEATKRYSWYNNNIRKLICTMYISIKMTRHQ